MRPRLPAGLRQPPSRAFGPLFAFYRQSCAQPASGSYIVRQPSSMNMQSPLRHLIYKDDARYL